MTLAAIKQRLLEYIGGRRLAYQTTFLNPPGNVVLKHLAKFCRAHESTFHPDHAVSDRLDGRREVWLEIQRHLQLTDEQLYQLYTPKQFNERGN